MGWSLNACIMKAKRIFNILLILVVLVSNVGCDQVSKAIARNSLGDHQTVSLVNDHLKLLKVENKGAFLSLGSALPVFLRIILLNILPLVVLGLTGFYVFTRTNLSRMTTIGTCFVIGGGLGNIYDRMIYGSVTDFLHIDFVIFQTGVFNLADVSIMVGAFVIVLDVVRQRKIEVG
ncbi:signal peptidase II [Chryseolinea serpens]|uniref:Lipoprotein signal peptidase n=2 Tax=Chryseolinea serpens TaxID=947013 RepID=A0A1M5NI68_9BACT|nr:signal peptidase II [Chryseolinea serpens]